jgi:hypothetical protein
MAGLWPHWREHNVIVARLCRHGRAGCERNRGRVTLGQAASAGDKKNGTQKTQMDANERK